MVSSARVSMTSPHNNIGNRPDPDYDIGNILDPDYCFNNVRQPDPDSTIVVGPPNPDGTIIGNPPNPDRNNNNTISSPPTADRNNNVSSQPPNSEMSKTPPRRWLIERIQGESKYGDRARPCGPCCWVPPPVGWCPGLWEENSCCKMYGRVGAYTSERARFWCMHVGFLANLAACLLMAYSCFAISQDFTMLSKSSFGSLTMRERDGKIDGEIFLRIGLRAIALDNPFTGVDRAVVGFDKFCDVSDDGLQRYIDPENCSSCFDNSLNFCISAILAVISFLPTFFTDILRMFSGYDVNCQKAFGTFFSLCTIGLAVNVLFTWKFFCGDTFFKNEIYLDVDGNRVSVDDPSREYTIDYNYTWGWGLMAMFLGACLKFMEVVAHFCVPTPSITRELKEQQIYEVIREEDLA